MDAKKKKRGWDPNLEATSGGGLAMDAKKKKRGWDPNLEATSGGGLAMDAKGKTKAAEKYHRKNVPHNEQFFDQPQRKN